MIQRKMQSRRRYLLAFLIGTAIFILGFALTYAVSYFEFQRILGMQDITSYEIFQDKLQYSFFGDDICSTESYQKVSQALGFQGRIIDDLEKKFGKNDKKVLFRKKFYSLILLEHFEFVKILNEECKSGINTILFFYSNQANDIKTSEKTGELLTIISRKYDNLVIYSFDINLDSDLVQKLKEKYDIQESSTLIINEESKIVIPKKIGDIEQYI